MLQDKKRTKPAMAQIDSHPTFVPWSGTTTCAYAFVTDSPILLPNSLYRAACFGNFEGILGFSVPTIIWVGAGLCKS